MLSLNERRKGEVDRRKKEQRRNWAITFELRDDDWWKVEELNGRRRRSNDHRRDVLNRRKADRRKVGEQRVSERRKDQRRGDKSLRWPIMPVREVPEQVLKARAASGGTIRQRLVRAGVDLSGPTRVYKPPKSPVATKSVTEKNSEETNPSPFEETFPGLLEPFWSVVRAVRRGRDWLKEKK